MKINMLNIELELPYDLTVADDADKWESHVNNLTESMKDIESKKYGQGDVIRKQIEALKQWLDDVFGSGSGAKVFEGRESLKTVYIVYKLIQGLHLVIVPKMVDEAWKDALKQYSPERAQRVVKK